jgi:hypothetical protein
LAACLRPAVLARCFTMWDILIRTNGRSES